VERIDEVERGNGKEMGRGEREEGGWGWG